MELQESLVINYKLSNLVQTNNALDSHIYFSIAEKCLESIENKQNYPLLLLHLVEKDGVDMTLRTAGAVTFQNLKFRYQLCVPLVFQSGFKRLKMTRSRLIHNALNHMHLPPWGFAFNNGVIIIAKSTESVLFRLPSLLLISSGL